MAPSSTRTSTSRTTPRYPTWIPGWRAIFGSTITIGRTKAWATVPRPRFIWSEWPIVYLCPSPYFGPIVVLTEGSAIDTTRVSKDPQAILQVFDNNLDQVLTDLMQDRLRFNTFVRLFFASLTIEVDPPGKGWNRGLERKTKGELAEWNPRITQFTLEPRFNMFVQQTGLRLPTVLQMAAVSEYDHPTGENPSAFM